jgi:hypothetical protein
MLSVPYVARVICLLVLIQVGCTSADGDASPGPSVAASAPAVPGTGDQSEPVGSVSWAEILGRAVVLSARNHFEDTEVSLDIGRVDAGGWYGAEDVSSCEITFRRRGAEDAAASYIIAPWQRLSWKGTGVIEEPSVITVTEHAIVLGPIIGSDQGPLAKRLVEQSYRHVADMVDESQYEDGTTAGGTKPGDSSIAMPPELVKPEAICLFKPCYVRLEYPSGPPILVAKRDKDAFGAVVDKRMLLVIQERDDPKAPGQVIQYEWFPPTPIDRSRPRPFDPGEQRLAPEVDLRAAGMELDRSLREVIGGAQARVASLGESTRSTRLGVYEAALPALEEAIFAYPGHTGPAYAAGASALEYWQEWLRSLLLEFDFTHDVEGYWPATLPVYRPDLIEQIRTLPPAGSEYLPELLQLFVRCESLAKERPGRWNEDPPAATGESRTYEPSAEELLLAELGDRIRTVLRTMPADSTAAIIATSAPGLTSLSYEGFDFHIHDPLGDHIYWVSEPSEISVYLPNAGG